MPLAPGGSGPAYGMGPPQEKGEPYRPGWLCHQEGQAEAEADQQSIGRVGRSAPDETAGYEDEGEEGHLFAKLHVHLGHLAVVEDVGHAPLFEEARGYLGPEQSRSDRRRSLVSDLYAESRARGDFEYDCGRDAAARVRNLHWSDLNHGRLFLRGAKRKYVYPNSFILYTQL